MDAPVWVQYLNAFSVLATAAATIVLAVVTYFYTKHTARMAEATRKAAEAETHAIEEMRESRLASIRPVLVPNVRMTAEAEGAVHWGVKNIGPGPALDVKLTLGWTEAMFFVLTKPVISSGEERWVDREGAPGHANLAYESLRRDNPVLWLKGSCSDLAGNRYDIDIEVPFRDEWKMDYPEALKKMTLKDVIEAMEAAKGTEESHPPDAGV